MRKLLLLLLLAGLAAPLAAQDPTGAVTTQNVVNTVVPATPIDEGPPRYPEVIRPTDFSDPTPEYADRPHTGPVAPVSKDLVTGVETLHPLPVGPFAPAGFVTGRVIGDEVRENISRSFNQLSAVTSSSFPWSAHVRMWFSQSGLNYVCSGTMIDAKHFLTAGHCVHEGSGGAWSTGVSASPAWDGDDDAFGSANGTNMVSWSSWTTSGSWDGDQAIVRIDRPFGFLTGWFGYGYNDSNSWWSSTTFNTTGWPGSSWPGAPDQFYYGYGTWDQVDTYTVEADCPPWTYWIGGMSGGGVYYIDGGTGNRYAYANNSHGWGKGSNITTRFGVCRMTSGKYDYYLNTYVPGGYSTTTQDLVPLDVNADMGGASIYPGQPLASMDYLVANESLYNPASQSVPVNTYLSTNDNISTADTLIQSHTFTWDFAAKSTVRVGYSTPPTIPSTTSAGTYWVGVILDITDGNTANNDTDGWDAVELTVVDPPPYWPNKPSYFRPVNSGVTVYFDTAGGVVQNWMGVNSLTADHLGADPEGWCNIGQLGACLSTQSGAYCLEMGLDPATSNYHDVANGFILGLDGTADGDLFLDFWAINHGEEVSVDDGVFVSDDGDSWVQLVGDWSGVGSTWGQTTGIALSSAGANTNGDFYVLFGQRDNFPYGYLDGIGIDTVDIGPAGRTLSVTPVVAGSPFTVTVSNCTPASSVYVAWSARGGGPTSTAYGTAYLTPPYTTLAPLRPNTLGTASVTQTAPASSAGMHIWVHALELPAGEFTNPIDFVIG
jgi:V8-like Glu-specific endopeptidase